MSNDSTIEVLSAAGCRELLASQDVGRVAFFGEEGFSIVLPVNYLIDGELIVFPDGPGGEVHVDPHATSNVRGGRLRAMEPGGWRVLVQGYGQDLTTATNSRYSALRHRTITNWAPGAKSQRLAIDVRHISGRRVSSIPEPTRSEFGTDDA